MPEKLPHIAEEDLISEQEIMDFLSGKLPPAQNARVQKALESSPFLTDSAEGLQSFDNMSDAQKVAFQLNQNLLQTLKIKNRTKKLSPIGISSIWLIAIAAIIILSVLGYVILKMHQG